MMRLRFIFTSVLISVVLLPPLYVNAQSRPQPDTDSQFLRLGIGFNAGLPTSNTYDLTIGGDVRLQKDFKANFSGTLSAGYTSFFLTDELGGGTVDLIPIKAGIKLFPVRRLYVSAELGPAFGVDDNNGSVFGKGTLLVFAPGIGLGLDNGFDAGLRYEGFSTDGSILGQLAIRVAYGFKL